MPKKKYWGKLRDAERARLEHVTRRGQTAAHQHMRVRVLLTAADGWNEAEVTKALPMRRATVERLGQRFVVEGLAALTTHPRPGKAPLVDATGPAR